MIDVRRLAVMVTLFWVSVTPADALCRAWPEWAEFRQAYLQADGRVIDRSLPDQPTVSEAAGYAAFLALVGDDRPTFELIIRWVRDNLSGGDLNQRLPAWRWGHRDAGDWGVLDSNSASDADLWLAFDLVEAGRLWAEPRFARLGRQLAMRILDEEVVHLDDLGPVLLPGREGFVHDGQRAVVNPSYAPSFVLARLSSIDPRFGALNQSTDRLLDATVAFGFVPDWAEYVQGQGYRLVSGQEGRGAYNAIRVYLWTALMADGEARQRAMHRLQAFATQISGDELPEWFDPRTGESGGVASRAHRAALLPFLKQVAPVRYQRILRQLHETTAVAHDGGHYYGDVLALIALAYDEGRYAFASDGRLLRGSSSCRH